MTRRPLPVTIAALALLALCAVPREARAEPSSTATANPIDLVNGYLNFEIETALGPVASFHAGVDFLVWDGVWDDDDGDVFAIGPVLGLRLFPFLGAPSGLWVGPFAGVSYVRVGRGQNEDTFAGSTFGGMIGYTLVLADVLAASAGIGLARTDFAHDVDGSDVGRRRLEPRFRLALGFAF